MMLLVIYPESEGSIVRRMSMERACKEFRVSEKQILWAIKSGHHLKTLLFDEA